jgi:uncharacterized protein YqjF (DUF2071 family)
MMLYRLRRHPLPISARFTHSLVVTYAYPAALLQPLLPPGLVVDTYKEWGFVAIAMVQTKGLRPAFLPESLGIDFFLTGYRIFARFAGKPSLRGLRILRSDTDRRLMALGGNLLTHYGYVHCQASMTATDGTLAVSVRSPRGRADLDVVADLRSRPAPLPAGSPFTTLEDARRFAGPLPYTFDYESETHSIVMIKATRSHWEPQPIAVVVRKATFLDRPPFAQVRPVLANAFHVADVPYRWEVGVVEPLSEAA